MSGIRTVDGGEMRKIQPDFVLGVLFVVIGAFATTSCSVFERHGESGYAGKDGKKGNDSASSVSPSPQRPPHSPFPIGVKSRKGPPCLLEVE